MAKANRLTTRKIDRIATPGIYGDGNTLFLKVRDDGNGGRGSAQWVQILKINGKRYERGLGGYPIVTLEEARQVAFDNRRKAKHGENPFEKPAPAVATLAPTFKDAMEAVIAIQRGDWTNGKSEKQWRASLRDYAMPKLGRKRVDAIQTPDVLACLQPIWNTKRETANRVKQRISAIMDWAIAKGHRQDNPVAAVDAVLPKARNGRKHYRALPYSAVPSAIAAVRNSKAHPATKLAFEFLVLTAARSGEVRMATWDEIDKVRDLWTIPAGRMKANAEHVVPLPEQAMEVLHQSAKRYGISGLLFPSITRKALSDATISKLLRENGINAVPHGFRSSFRDWAGENGWERDIAEAALAHTVRNAVEAAYHRTSYLKQRKAMMEQWAKFCLPD